MTEQESSWFKSSYSGSSGDNCVELAVRAELVKIRDSKDLRIQPLAVSRTAWSRFATSVARDSA